MKIMSTEFIMIMMLIYLSILPLGIGTFFFIEFKKKDVKIPENNISISKIYDKIEMRNILDEIVEMKFKKVENKIDNKFKELENKLVSSISDTIKQEMKESIKNEIMGDFEVQQSYLEIKSEAERQKIERAQMRIKLKPEKIEEKVIYVVQKAVDRLVRRNYLKTSGRAGYVIDFGEPDDATQGRTKKQDLKEIWEDFFNIVSKHNLYEDLSLLYDLEATGLEDFVIEEYIVPYYLEVIKGLQSIQRKTIKINRELEKRELEEIQAIERLQKELMEANGNDFNNIKKRLDEAYESLSRSNDIKSGNSIGFEEFKNTTGIDLNENINNPLDYIEEFEKNKKDDEILRHTTTPRQYETIKERENNNIRDMSLDDLTSLVNNPNWAKYGLDFKIPSSRDFI